jgi:hypothetical protein
MGLAGAAISAAGIAMFSWAYPERWVVEFTGPGVQDYSVVVLATYVLGTVVLVGATFASLVADFVLRMQIRARLRGELGREPTDGEIQADIDEAMRKHKVSWGGMGPDPTKGLTVHVEALPKEWQAAMPKFGREYIASGERVAAVDGAVDKLLDFRGGRIRKGELPENGLGAAADHLKALRDAKAHMPKRSLWQRFVDWVHGRKLSDVPQGWEAKRATQFELADAAPAKKHHWPHRHH